MTGAIFQTKGGEKMEAMTSTVISGKPRFLHYSISVLFDVVEVYGSIQAALEKLSGDDRAAFETVQWFALKMAEDAELVRRAAGHAPAPMLTEKELTMQMSPFAFETLRAAVVAAIEKGYAREVEEPEEEIDVGLAELRAKKEMAVR